jgi:DNA-binding MarR family transcriptional regulator
MMQTKDLQRSLYLQSPKLNKLNLLREVAHNAHITQAELANRCFLSVAMVNNYMKEMCGAGLIEYHRKSIKSVTYHLTPEGYKQLATLQSEMIDDMVNMFAAAKEQIRESIVSQTNPSIQRVVIYGNGHLAQLAFHALELAGISILGICSDDPMFIGKDFCGREVLNPAHIRYLAPDAVVIADSRRSQEISVSLNALSERGIALIPLDGNIIESQPSASLA